MNKALLIGGPLDGEWIDLELEADNQILPFEIAVKEGEEVIKTRIYYRIAPMQGMDTTWYLGRFDGVEFDESITHLLQCYHLTSAKRGFNERLPEHKRGAATEHKRGAEGGGSGI